MNKRIDVAKPFLPPSSEYVRFVESIWQNEWLTNNGPLLQQFEHELKAYLNTQHLLVLANGTLGLQIAMKALGLKPGDEIITTPFSYVATTSSIVWEGLSPVHVDIDPESFNIDPRIIEQSLTSRTKAILATHVFGNACDIDSIADIARAYNLKVIYDAAHCFGVNYKGQSILNFGDISVLSLHATKLFHCIEGGVMVTPNFDTYVRSRYFRNFGHDGYYKFNGVGINAKNSEFHAAMGLLNLKYADEILSRRKDQWLRYYTALTHCGYTFQRINDQCTFNYSYFPIVFESEDRLLRKMACLENESIFCRRYFYPSLNHLSYVEKRVVPVCEDLASRILCLPLYHDLTVQDQERVIDALSKP